MHDIPTSWLTGPVHNHTREDAAVAMQCLALWRKGILSRHSHVVIDDFARATRRRPALRQLRAGAGQRLALVDVGVARPGRKNKLMSSGNSTEPVAYHSYLWWALLPGGVPKLAAEIDVSTPTTCILSAADATVPSNCATLDVLPGTTHAEFSIEYGYLKANAAAASPALRITACSCCPCAFRTAFTFESGTAACEIAVYTSHSLHAHWIGCRSTQHSSRYRPSSSPH